MNLPYCENFIIPTSAVLTDPPVCRTDGRTNKRTDERTGDSAKHICSCCMLSRAKNWQTNNYRGNSQITAQT